MQLDFYTSSGGQTLRNIPVLRSLTLTLLLAGGIARAAKRSISICRRPTTPRSKMPFFSVGSDRAIIYLRPEHQRDLLALQATDHFPVRAVSRHLQRGDAHRDATGGRLADLQLDEPSTRFIDQLAAAKLRPRLSNAVSCPGRWPAGSRRSSGGKVTSHRPGSMDEVGSVSSRNLPSTRSPSAATMRYAGGTSRCGTSPTWTASGTGGQEGYFKLFAATSKALKLVDPHLRVGGPSTAGMAWIPELLGYCKEHHVAIDFVSSHTYAATAGFLDENGKKATTFRHRPPGVGRRIRPERRTTSVRAPFPSLPLFITEWGPSYSPRDPIHDSYVCVLRSSSKSCNRASTW